MRRLALAAVPVLLLAGPAAAELRSGWPSAETLARQFVRRIIAEHLRASATTSRQPR